MANSQSDIKLRDLFSQGEPDASIFYDDDIDGPYTAADDQGIFESPYNFATLDELSQTMMAGDSSSELLVSSASLYDHLTDDLFDNASNPDFSDYSSDLLMVGAGDLSSSSECMLSRLNSGSRKIRSRTDGFCDDPSNSNADQVPASVPAFKAFSNSLYVETQKKWCSETGVTGFGNIPVCNTGNAFPEPSELDMWRFVTKFPLEFSGFVSIYFARLSKLVILADSDGKFQLTNI